MPARTLAEVSGRRALRTGTDSSPQHHRKRVKKLTDDPTPAKTESVHSDEPVPASSGVFQPKVPQFSLEQSYPSIMATVHLMRNIKESDGTDALRSLSRVFLSCLRTIACSLINLPDDVRLAPDVEVAQYAVLYAGDLLEKELDGDERMDTLACHRLTMKHVKTTVATLRSFIQVVARVFAETKPLPALPSLDVGALAPCNPTGSEDVSLIQVVNDVIKTSGGVQTAEVDIELQPVVGDSSEPLEANNKRKSRSGILIYRILRRRAKARGSPSSPSLPSSGTLLNAAPSHLHVESDSKDPVTTSEQDHLSSSNEQPEDKPTEKPYLPRISAIYFHADPYNPEVDVDMPLPTGDAAAVRLDTKGVMKSASLTALVRILTSMESVVDQEFIPTFFVCFRFFTTPQAFLNALIQRFSEPHPEGLNSVQLEVWVRNRVSDHIRIAKVILFWLDVYWKPDADECILQDLQDFVLHRLVQVVPQGLAEAVLVALDNLAGDTPVCRRSRKAYDLKFIYHRTAKTTLSPNKFVINIDKSGFIGSQVLTFNTSEGRELFARQITHYISEVFRQVDPEDAILFWHLREVASRKDEADAMEAGKILRKIIDFERALSLLVTFTVLDDPGLRERQQLIRFWLDISSRCIRLRNFSGAHCILAGLSNGAVTRLKWTILELEYATKQQFRTLKELFSGRDNYAEYRDILTAVEPTIPYIAPFIRDIVSALNVMPTTVAADDQSKEKTMINLCSYRIVLKTVRAMESCLIPYEIEANETFLNWFTALLLEFPPDQEAEFYDKFYGRSKDVEGKDAEFQSITEPWDYMVEGELALQYTLHMLPPVCLERAPKKAKNRFRALFKKFSHLK